ncbi:StsA family sactipeptide RiPP [Streptomyces sp. NPDC020965]
MKPPVWVRPELLPIDFTAAASCSCECSGGSGAGSGQAT